MINPFKEIDWNPDRAKRRSFAISLFVGFPCIALLWCIVGWLRTGEVNAGIPLRLAASGAAAGALFFAVPSIARPFYVAWYTVAAGIGLVVGNILMAVVYFGVVTVVGVFVRAAGKLTLKTAIDRGRESYWLDAGPPQPPQRYYRQF